MKDAPEDKLRPLIDELSAQIERLREDSEIAPGIRGTEMRGTRRSSRTPGVTPGETTGDMDYARHRGNGAANSRLGQSRPKRPGHSNLRYSGALDLLADPWVLLMFGGAIATFVFRVAIAT